MPQIVVAKLNQAILALARVYKRSPFPQILSIAGRFQSSNLFYRLLPQKFSLIKVYYCSDVDVFPERNYSQINNCDVFKNDIVRAVLSISAPFLSVSFSQGSEHVVFDSSFYPLNTYRFLGIQYYDSYLIGDKELWASIHPDYMLDNINVLNELICRWAVAFNFDQENFGSELNSLHTLALSLEFNGVLHSSLLVYRAILTHKYFGLRSFTESQAFATLNIARLLCRYQAITSCEQILNYLDLNVLFPASSAYSKVIQQDLKRLRIAVQNLY